MSRVQPVRRVACFVVTILVLASAMGCAAPAPIVSGPASSTPIVLPATSPTLPGSVTNPPATATPTAVVPSPVAAGQTPPLSSATPGLALDIHNIPDSWALNTGPFPDSDGTEVVWSAISSRVVEGQPYLGDIVAFAPRTDAEPHFIYHDPEPDTRIWDSRVRAGRYAFVERNERLLGTGWRLWALPGANEERVLLDTMDGPDNAPAPKFTLTDERVIWAAVHPRDGVLTYELRSARFDGSDNHALLASPVEKRQYWYPFVDPAGTHVLFATVEPSGKDWRFRIFSLDLTDANAQPVRLGTSEEATQPLTNGTTIVWRVVDGNVSNSGKDLVTADANGDHPSSLGIRNNLFPTMGNRYLTQQGDRSQVTLYDVVTGASSLVIQLAPLGGWRLQRGWTMVAGDLLIFRPTVNEEGLAPAVQVSWAILPSLHP